MRRALTSVDGIIDIKLDYKSASGTFRAPEDLDIEETLNKFADEGNKHIAGWSMVE